MKYAIVAIGVALAATLFSGSSAHAHTVLRDTSKTRSALLHVQPDDNPIAGEQSTLYFDTQQGDGLFFSDDSVVTLTLRHETAPPVDITANMNGSLATFTYTFPSQGLYELSFLAIANGKQYEFTQDWRVSRGVTLLAVDAPDHAWAEIVLLAAGVSGAILALVMIGRWRTIWRLSRF